MGFSTKEESEKATYLGVNVIHVHFPNYKPAGTIFSVFNNGTCIGQNRFVSIREFYYTV